MDQIKHRAKMKILRLWDCLPEMQRSIEGEGPVSFCQVLGLPGKSPRCASEERTGKACDIKKYFLAKLG